MNDIEDPVRELFGHLDQTLRVSLAGGLQLAQQQAIRTREEERVRSQQALVVGRELEERRRAERLAARALWQQASSPEWWDQASARDIASAYQAAYAYTEVDDEARKALVRIEAECEQRFGVVPDNEGVPRVVGAPTGRDQARPGTGAVSPEQLERWRAAAGEELADSMIASRSWPKLERRLAALDRVGTDSAAALSGAVAMREMGTAHDVARLLDWRLSERAPKAADRGSGVEEAKSGAHSTNGLGAAAFNCSGKDSRATGATSPVLAAEEEAMSMRGQSRTAGVGIER